MQNKDKKAPAKGTLNNNSNKASNVDNQNRYSNGQNMTTVTNVSQVVDNSLVKVKKKKRKQEEELVTRESSRDGTSDEETEEANSGVRKGNGKRKGREEDESREYQNSGRETSSSVIISGDSSSDSDNESDNNSGGSKNITVEQKKKHEKEPSIPNAKQSKSKLKSKKKKDHVEISFEHLNTDHETGLDDDEVESRLQLYGANSAEEKQKSLIVKFLLKFVGITPILLLIGAIISAVLARYINFGLILALVILNAMIGFYQEKKAADAVEELKTKLKISAKVLRNSEWNSIDSRELVPGDIIRIRHGDIAPADLKLVKTAEGGIIVDESAINGESEPKEIEVGGKMVYAGSIIKSGEAMCVVTATGLHTYFGKAVQLLTTSTPKLHIEKVLTFFTMFVVAVVIVLIIVAIIILVVNKVYIVPLIPLLIAIIVSALPMALPAMFTITMAFGSRQLSQRGVLVTRLSATEDAASMDILCSDKTGTITTNKLELRKWEAIDGNKKKSNPKNIKVKSSKVDHQCNHTDDDILLFAFLCSHEENNDPIDTAVCIKHKENSELLAKSREFQELKFQPFEPKTRRTAAYVEHVSSGKKLSITKGALQSLYDICHMTDSQRKAIQKRADMNFDKGYRVLGIAISNGPLDSDKWNFIGILVFYDAPRPDSKKVISDLEKLGVRVIMITGDSVKVAKSCAEEVGLGSEVFPAKKTIAKPKAESGSESSNDRDNSEDEEDPLDFNLETVHGIAEVYPEHKHMIVNRLQKSGHVVGMTGDGVNDAPALKQAEVGVAVSNATDIAKGAASCVLTVEGLSAMVPLVQTGRQIHKRIVTWIINKVVKTFQTAIFVVVAFLVIGEFPIDDGKIILLLFLVDFVTLALATDNVRWSKRPEKWDLPVLVSIGTVLGFLVTLESFAIFYIGIIPLKMTQIQEVYTYVFNVLFFFGTGTIFTVRQRSWFWKAMPSVFLLCAIIGDAIVIIIISAVGIPTFMTPIPIQNIAIVIGWCIGCSFLINDPVKVFLYFLIKRIRMQQIMARKSQEL